MYNPYLLENHLGNYCDIYNCERIKGIIDVLRKLAEICSIQKRYVKKILCSLLLLLYVYISI